MMESPAIVFQSVCVSFIVSFIAQVFFPQLFFVFLFFSDYLGVHVCFVWINYILFSGGASKRNEVSTMLWEEFAECMLSGCVM